MVALAHQPMEEPGKSLQPLDRPDSCLRSRLNFGELVSLPRFSFGAWLAQEQNLAKFFVLSIGVKKQDCLFLFHARQIKQVRADAHGKAPIGIGRHRIVAVDNRERVGRHRFADARSILFEQTGVDGCIPHDGTHSSKEPGGIQIQIFHFFCSSGPVRKIRR